MKTILVLDFIAKSSLIPRLLALTPSIQLHLHARSTFSYNVMSMPENSTPRLMCSPCNDEMMDRNKEGGVQGMHYWVTSKGKAAISGCSRRRCLPDPAMGTKNPMAHLPLNALLCADDDGRLPWQLLLCAGARRLQAETDISPCNDEMTDSQLKHQCSA